MTFLEELSAKRITYNNTNNYTVWLTELLGGEVIVPTAFEPDPYTHRSEYYYNAITNQLFKKIKVQNGPTTYKISWKKVSDQ